VASAEASLESSLLENNGTGLEVGSGKAMVTASVLSGNLDGLFATGSSEVAVDKSQLASNTGYGVVVVGANVRLTRSVVTGNNVGLSNVVGTITVTGTNAIRGNAIDTNGTITLGPLQ
jgi:hypothetical protein